MMLCNNCNKEIEDQALFCNYCGVSQKANKNAQQRVCPKCRIEFDDDVIFCNLCGAKLIADCPSENVGTSNNEYGDELLSSYNFVFLVADARAGIVKMYADRIELVLTDYAPFSRKGSFVAPVKAVPLAKEIDVCHSLFLTDILYAKKGWLKNTVEIYLADGRKVKFRHYLSHLTANEIIEKINRLKAGKTISKYFYK